MIGRWLTAACSGHGDLSLSLRQDLWKWISVTTITAEPQNRTVTVTQRREWIKGMFCFCNISLPSESCCKMSCTYVISKIVALYTHRALSSPEEQHPYSAPLFRCRDSGRNKVNERGIIRPHGDRTLCLLDLILDCMHIYPRRQNYGRRKQLSRAVCILPSNIKRCSTKTSKIDSWDIVRYIGFRTLLPSNIRSSLWELCWDDSSDMEIPRSEGYIFINLYSIPRYVS